jgi:hypothetical protein
MYRDLLMHVKRHLLMHVKRPGNACKQATSVYADPISGKTALF